MYVCVHIYMYICVQILFSKNMKKSYLKYFINIREPQKIIGTRKETRSLDKTCFLEGQFIGMVNVRFTSSLFFTTKENFDKPFSPIISPFLSLGRGCTDKSLFLSPTYRGAHMTHTYENGPMCIGQDLWTQAGGERREHKSTDVEKRGRFCRVRPWSPIVSSLIVRESSAKSNSLRFSGKRKPWGSRGRPSSLVASSF